MAQKDDLVAGGYTPKKGLKSRAKRLLRQPYRGAF
jgi:hypothetical protein